VHHVLLTKSGASSGAVPDDHVAAFNTVLATIPKRQISVAKPVEVLETIPKRQISATKPVEGTAASTATPPPATYIPSNTVEMPSTAYDLPSSTFQAPLQAPLSVSQDRQANSITSGSRSSGILGAIVTGVVKGTISGLTGTQNQFSFGGGGGGFDQVDYSSMVFQSGLQQNFGGNLIG
jgi:hypothetical protein